MNSSFSNNNDNNNDIESGTKSDQTKPSKLLSDESYSNPQNSSTHSVIIQYICFATMIGSVVAAVQFYQGISQEALGKQNKTGIAILLFTQYFVQTICNVTTPYWLKMASIQTRMLIVTICSMVGFIVASFFYENSIHRNGDSLLYVDRFIIIACVSINGVATVVTEISLLKYVALYHPSCTNAISTGSGIGAVIGASWALLPELETFNKQIAVLTCLLFPAILFVCFFFILPKPTIPNNDNTTIDKNENKTTHSNNIETIHNTTSNVVQEMHEPVVDHNSNKETVGGIIESSNSNNSIHIASKTNNIITSGDIESGIEEVEKELDLSNVNIITLTKMVFIDFWKYSLPLFICYFGFEFSRAGIFGRIWPKDKSDYFKKFNLVFRISSGIGKASTNAIRIKQYYIFPFIIGIFGICLTLLHLIPTNDLSNFIINTNGGQILVSIFGAIPVGIAYGSTSANVFYALRTDIANQDLKQFALANVRQVTTYGQILGTSLSMLLKLFD